MERPSKTEWEIFTDKYPVDSLINPFISLEACGYLRCLAMHVPSYTNKCNETIAILRDYAYHELKEML